MRSAWLRYRLMPPAKLRGGGDSKFAPRGSAPAVTPMPVGRASSPIRFALCSLRSATRGVSREPTSVPPRTCFPNLTVFTIGVSDRDGLGAAFPLRKAALHIHSARAQYCENGLAIFLWYCENVNYCATSCIGLGHSDVSYDILASLFFETGKPEKGNEGLANFIVWY